MKFVHILVAGFESETSLTEAELLALTGISLREHIFSPVAQYSLVYAT